MTGPPPPAVGRPRENHPLGPNKNKASYEEKTNATWGLIPLPLVGLDIQNQFKKGDSAARSLRSRLQAHPSMRICSAGHSDWLCSSAPQPASAARTLGGALAAAATPN